MQRQKQHFYQESQNDGNQKQRENYSFHNMRWKSSEKPERHEERTVTKQQNNPETKWHEYKDAQKWDRLSCRDNTTVRGEGLLHVWDQVSWLHLFSQVTWSSSGLDKTAGHPPRGKRFYLSMMACVTNHTVHTCTHTHTHLSLPSSCGSIAVTAGKSSRSTKQCHFQLSGGLKADSPGNDAAGRKSAPVSRHGSHAATRLWIKRQ